jgi:hypothetical protein
MNFRTCTSYKREIWNFNNVDFPALNIAVLGIDWYSLFDSEFDIDNVYNTWVAPFHTIIEKYIPRKTVTIRPRDKPWMNGIVRRAIRRRNVCFVFIIKNEGAIPTAWKMANVVPIFKKGNLWTCITSTMYLKNM